MALTLDEKKVLAYDYARYLVAVHPDYFPEAAITIVDPDFIDPSYLKDECIDEKKAKSYLLNRKENDQFDSIGKNSNNNNSENANAENVTIVNCFSNRNILMQSLFNFNFNQNTVNNSLKDNITDLFTGTKSITTLNSNKYSSVKINKQEQWIDIDYYSNNNHFMPEHCFVAVTFNNSKDDGNYFSLNLPVYPVDVNNSITTNYSSASMIGRVGSVYAYNSTADKTTSFALHMHRELKVISNPTTNKSELKDINKIDAIVALIESAQYPKYTSNGLYPPIVTYRFGDTQIEGIQTTVNTTWSGPKIDGMYMEVKLSISVTNLPDSILSNEDVRNKNPRGYGYLGNYSPSTTNTNNNTINNNASNNDSSIVSGTAAVTSKVSTAANNAIASVKN